MDGQRCLEEPPSGLGTDASGHPCPQLDVLGLCLPVPVDTVTLINHSIHGLRQHYNVNTDPHKGENLLRSRWALVLCYLRLESRLSASSSREVMEFFLSPSFRSWALWRVHQYCSHWYIFHLGPSPWLATLTTCPTYGVTPHSLEIRGHRQACMQLS